MTHGVLMHVPPASVREALRELLRVARKTLWLIEEQVLTPAARGSSFSINEYTFAHDYDALFRELGVRPAQIEYDGKVVVLIRMRIDVG